MRDIKNDAEIMERIIHKYIQTENRKLDYGTGIKLTTKEIHTINIVGSNPSLNITELAKLQGVTKGAVSQMIYKLVDKKHVLKRPSPDSDVEVCLELTRLGQIAYQGHMEYHKKSQEEFFGYLRKIPDDAHQQMLDILNAFEQMIDHKLNEK